LVLPVQVRILIGQLNKKTALRAVIFYYSLQFVAAGIISPGLKALAIDANYINPTFENFGFLF
jgi:hypothetical protein